MNIFYPILSIDRLPTMIRIALLGALLAGPYGAIHDQISYAISPEFFTKLKFKQFSYADFGLHPRIFAAEVGFLATWWVGFIAGWFLARAGLDAMPEPARRKCLIKAFSILLSVTPLCGMLGVLIGLVVTSGSMLSLWSDLQREFGLVDLRAFVIVGCLHNAGYLGALIGLVLAVIYVRRSLAREVVIRATVA